MVDAETAVAMAVANAAIESVNFEQEWLTRLYEVASGQVSAEDLTAAEIDRLGG
ncbi:hypothetical protein ACH495_20805 [Micromonospora sp. NPDC018662]|uniref:hypothetical protein n=1 Tax=Micromonospora sp. NPDC018662 TaxID=3364238 RepID=UPI00379BF701